MDVLEGRLEWCLQFYPVPVFTLHSRICFIILCNVFGRSRSINRHLCDIVARFPQCESMAMINSCQVLSTIRISKQLHVSGA